MANRGDESPQAEPIIGEATDAADPLVVQAKERVGDTLRGKWRLDVLLGVGGMAAVYAATHRNGSRAAVKLLHPEMSANAIVRERFLWEGYVANAVGHDGAVNVLDDDAAEDGSLFLVTELLDGETLEERRLRLGGRLPADEVLVATDQLLDVLAAAHAKGIVHRDLKPENVFLTRAGRVKVLDFGIARLRELSSAKGLTQTGTTVGTPAYMAPEHARGLSDEVDERSDLWACGAMMFCLLSGRNVHEGGTVNEQLVSAMTKHAPSLDVVAPGVAAEVVRVVDRALQFDKKMRWPDANAMQEAVRQAYEELHGRSIETAAPVRLGDDVPDRTGWQGSGPLAPRIPTTNRPVASSGWPPSEEASRVRRRPAIVTAGVVAVCGVAVGASLLFVARERANMLRQPTVALHSATSPPMPPSVMLAVPPAAPPESAPSSTLTAADSARPPDRVAWRRPSPPAQQVQPTPQAAPQPRVATPPPASSTSAPPQPDCQPPYTVDSVTLKRHWKLECL